MTAERTGWRIAALLLLAAAIVAPAASCASKATLRLTIAFTGDVSGYLEPCG